MTARAGSAAASGAATKLPPLHELLTGEREYPFVELEKRRQALVPPGVKAISFSAGDPREETPAFVRERLRASVPDVSSYPKVVGLPELREACAKWTRRRFGVTLDPERELLPLNGSKEGVFLLPLAVIDARGKRPARDTVVIPSPAYPVYETGAQFAGARVHLAPLSSANGWRFDPDAIPDDVWERTALLWLNSPHNPTGSVVPLGMLERITALARRHGFWVASDEAYVEVYFDDPPPSALQCGSENVIALHTLSKRSAMTGYRTGFMAGDARLIDAMKRFRPSVGVATPEFVQHAAVAAWNDEAHPDDQRGRYAVKRRLCMDCFERHGWTVEASEASFYLWVKAPGGDDVAFVERLLRSGLVALPGSFLGEAGKGYIRWALVPTVDECREAVNRIDAMEDADA